MNVRIKAWAIHLAISMLVLAPVLALIFYVWFPPPYFSAQGVLRISLILIGVQIGVGPVLTLLVYKPGKPGLKFDLWVIALAQFCALVFGAWAIQSERPAYLVFAVDRFEVLAEKDVNFAAAGMSGFGSRPFRGPLRVFAKLPEGPAFDAFQDSVLFSGKPDLERRPETWQAIAPNLGKVLAAARPYQAVRSGGDTPTPRDSRERSSPAEMFIPLVGKRDDFVAIIDPQTAEIIRIIRRDPWVR